jgi:predicted phage terminase large subunit-like protein
MKGKAKYDFMLMREGEGFKQKDIASELSMTHANYRNFKTRWKKKTSTQQLVPAQTRPAESAISHHKSDIIDTRSWSWSKWSLMMLGIELDQFQEAGLEQLDSYMRLVLNLPRRHGKTTILLRIFATRKLCETTLTNMDESFIYVSSNKDFVVDFVLLIASDLIDNDKVLEHYGFLLEDESVSEYRRVKKVKRKARRQTQMALNLGNRKDIFNHSLLGTTIKGAIRGKGATRVLIDDPMDEFHGVDSARRETKKIMRFVKEKIYPISIGLIAVVGTRYDIDGYDIFTQLGREMEGKVWKHITSAAVVKFGTYEVRESTKEILPSDIIIHEESEWQLLSVMIWNLRAEMLADQGIKCTGLQLLVYYYHITEKFYFQKEWQNNVAALLSKLKWEYLNNYSMLPMRGQFFKWGIFVDIGAGEKEKADYTAMVLVGRQERTNDFFIHDFIYGRWSSQKKKEMLEEFVQHSADMLSEDKFLVSVRDIKVYIETVMGQRDLYQRVRDESWVVPAQATPSKRGEKVTRITYGLAQEMENGKVYLHTACRNQQQLRVEMDGFPASEDNHAIDALDQIIFKLKRSETKIKAGWLE